MNKNDALLFLIRKLIFAKNSQDITHFSRLIDEIAQTFEQQGNRESARALLQTLHNGYTKSYYELSRQVQPAGCPFVNYEHVYTTEYSNTALRMARESARPMRVRHILEYIECGDIVAKDVFEYDAKTKKWTRIEDESKELFQ